ncbi:PREDICTED: prolyl 4-hydroxylase subunit alpha-1-like [Priapulus caudatus]|uniref:procollagen-proline 4-dioxygenase n=1 Tax=Priapulus caudatus TaxID=37621 RepID=A0ABM1EDZ8_PRICU|nr:PREDICTED: prolyl 4-hydroxylase subunit alpha-1-like [Priapulus caudatus]
MAAPVVMCLLMCLLGGATAELFTAMADMEHLVAAEKAVVDVLSDYIRQEELRLSQLKSLTAAFAMKNREAAQKPAEFLANPVNSFLLVKRLTADWESIEVLLHSGQADALAQNLTAYTENFPTKEDLKGAATALFRLQDTYRLNTADLAMGRVPGTTSFPELLGDECFEIGKIAYNSGDHYHTVMWMEEAMKRIQDDDVASRAEILEYLAFSIFMVDVSPDHSRASGNKRYYESYIETSEEKLRRKGDDGAAMKEEAPAQHAEVRHPVDHVVPEREAYEELCRQSPPRSILQLKRATVQNSVTGELETASYRVSKSAWLRSDEDAVVSRINQRIGDVTGLAMSTAEDLQIANYGLGGHYEPHFDFARREEKDAFKSLGTGNRIATVIFYMTDLEAGGATVFPRVGARIIPERGSAAFWYNLKQSGQGDYSTRHAACPVLAGTKWVANKWIHEIGQEFRRPCGLSEME